MFFLILTVAVAADTPLAKITSITARNTKTVFHRCLAALGLPGVFAFSLISEGPWGAKGFADGPNGVNYTVFSRLLEEQPNASSAYPLAAPDVSPMPGSTCHETVEGGWSWQIEVKADIPYNLSRRPLDPEERDKYFTGTHIILNAPPDQKAYGAWDLCVVRWEIDQHYPDALRHDDGSCSSALGDACRQAVADTSATDWKKHGCSCPNLRKLDACGGGDVPAAFTRGCFPRSDGPFLICAIPPARP